jgi:hypothetical protein
MRLLPNAVVDCPADLQAKMPVQVIENFRDGYCASSGHCPGSSKLARSVFVLRPVAEIQAIY